MPTWGIIGSYHPISTHIQKVLGAIRTSVSSVIFSVPSALIANPIFDLLQGFLGAGFFRVLGQWSEYGGMIGFCSGC